MTTITLNNDIYLEILKYTKLKDLLTLQKVNKFFKYYTNKYIKIQCFKKYVKNIRCNLLYQSTLFPIKHFNNEIFNISYNELINTNIHDVKLPSTLIKHNIEIKKKYFTTNTTRYGDILQSITIIGKNIKKVELYIGNILVSKCDYLNASLINWQPLLIGGIITLCLPYHDIEFKIYADECTKIYGYYKLIMDHDLRKYIALNEHIIPHAFYNSNDKYMYKQIKYCYGTLSMS
jgi:hypothetical protein